MHSQYCIEQEGLHACPVVARSLSQQLSTFVHPLLRELDVLLDLRLVHTFLATVPVLLEFRHRNHGLLKSLVRSLSGFP